ncbi:MAG: hypothetical protein ABL925_15385 [Methylococcales bacterium]
MPWKILSFSVMKYHQLYIGLTVQAIYNHDYPENHSYLIATRATKTVSAVDGLFTSTKQVPMFCREFAVSLNNAAASKRRILFFTV